MRERDGNSTDRDRAAMSLRNLLNCILFVWHGVKPGPNQQQSGGIAILSLCPMKIISFGFEVIDYKIVIFSTNKSRVKFI